MLIERTVNSDCCMRFSNKSKLLSICLQFDLALHLSDLVKSESETLRIAISDQYEPVLSLLNTLKIERQRNY